jgi:ubiquinone/menaquinone biosynthesis C-methylase UbiE
MREYKELIFVIRCEHGLEQFLAVIPHTRLLSVQHCSVKRDFHTGNIWSVAHRVRANTAIRLEKDKTMTNKKMFGPHIPYWVLYSHQVKMRFVRRIGLRLGRRFGVGRRRLSPVEGYDRWAATYDVQADNVVFALESPLFSEMLALAPIEGNNVVDIGCGTGRHWPEILLRNPAAITGVDPSPKMLQRLQAHYPDARTICSMGEEVPEIADSSCHIVVSTLSLAHIPAAVRAMKEWARILRRGGSMLITDFHPDAILAGMKRTFKSEDGTFEIEHYATDLETLRGIAVDCGFAHEFTAEREIDESVRGLYERAQYLEAYEKHKGRPLVFGMHFVKL